MECEPAVILYHKLKKEKRTLRMYYLISKIEFDMDAKSCFFKCTVYRQVWLNSLD